MPFINDHDYKILKYIEWDYGRKYASITDKEDNCEKITCLYPDSCEECSDPCGSIKKSKWFIKVC